MGIVVVRSRRGSCSVVELFNLWEADGIRQPCNGSARVVALAPEGVDNHGPVELREHGVDHGQHGQVDVAGDTGGMPMATATVLWMLAAKDLGRVSPKQATATTTLLFSPRSRRRCSHVRMAT